MSRTLCWRVPNGEQLPATDAHIVALTRAFGPLPYRTGAHDVHLLRAMAATEEPGGVYEQLAELVERHRVIEIFAEAL